MKTRTVVFAALLAGCAGAPRQVEFPAEPGRLAAIGALDGGLQHGEWTYRHDDGTIESQGTYRDDRRDGPWTYWYPGGVLRMRGAWADDRQEGRWEFHHPDGSPMCAGDYRAGREHGEWTYHHRGGALRQRGVFADGRRVLEWAEYDEHGALLARGLYHEDVPVGGWTMPAGARSRTVEYAFPPGVEHRREEHQGGGVRREGFLRDGERSGPWIVRHADGSLRALVRFERGAPVGELAVFGANGERIAYGAVEGSRLTGTWRVRIDGAWRDERPVPRPPWDRQFVVAPGAVLSPLESAGRALDELSAPLEPLPLVVAVREEDTTAHEPPIERLDAPTDPGHWTIWERANFAALRRFYRDGFLEPSLRGSQQYGARIGGGLGHGDARAVRAWVGERVPDVPLYARDGSRFSLVDLRGRAVLLVVLRGFTQHVCVYCFAQTSELAPVVPLLREEGCQVVVLFPGSRSRLEAFVEACREEFGPIEPPWTLAYDPDLALVRALGLEGNVARPAALAIDREGRVREGYAAESAAHDGDRPPVTELVRWIQGLR